MTVMLFVLLGLGVPVGIAFSLIIVTRADAWNIVVDFVAQTTLDALLIYPFLAIPLFILGGELMTRGGLTQKLVDISKRVLGWTHAPLGHIMIGASAMMGAITGSSVAAVAAIGRAIGPEMLARGYLPGYVGALNASAGLLGVLLPPSIPLILYGSAVGVSITQLFMATLLPGMLFLAAFMITHSLRAKHVLEGGRERALASDRQTHLTLRQAISALPALFLPILVLGGIYSGLFTPTEAASIAALYALLFMLFNRAARQRDIGNAFVKAAISAAAVLFIIGFTTIFNRALTLEQVPQMIAGLAISYTENPLVFLLMVNLALLIVGMFMETSAAVLLMGPLLAPAAVQYGIDPVHFGIVLVVNIEIGLLTPPLAANLYVAALTSRIAIIPLIRQVGWFLLACLTCLVLITYIPQIALWYRYLPGL